MCSAALLLAAALAVISVSPIDASQETIWAAECKLPKNADLELLDHPATAVYVACCQF